MLAGRSVRTFSDLMSTPDYSNKTFFEPASQHSPFYTLTASHKCNNKVKTILKVLEQLASKDDELTEAETFAAKQAIKSIAKHLRKIVPNEMKMQLRQAGLLNFSLQTGVAFVPELVTDAQAHEISNTSEIVVTLIGSDKVKTNSRVVAVIDR